MRAAIVIGVLLPIFGCTEKPSEPDVVPVKVRRAPIVTDVGGRIDVGYVLLPDPKIVTAVPAPEK
jgi:hypothetical protein